MAIRSEGPDIPKFRKKEFFPKKNKYCVCVFVVNEGERLGRQLLKMKNLSDIVDIVLADGGSSDGSTRQDLSKNLNVNTLLVKEDTGKLGAQMRMAFAWVLERKYEGVIIIDGNEKDGVDAIPLFLSKLEEGYDHIQGSRFLPGGYHENTPLLRLVGLKLIHIPLIRLASGFRYTDTTNGFRAYSARLLSSSKIALFRSVFTDYELHYYLAVKSPRLNFKCIEVPVSRVYPKGKNPTKISLIKGNMQILCKLFSVLFGKYNPKRSD